MGIHALPHARAIGALLRTARESQGLTLRDVAARTDISYQNISRIERGQLIRPPARTMTLLADVVGLAFDATLYTTLTDEGMASTCDTQPQWSIATLHQFRTWEARLAESAVRTRRLQRSA